MLIDEKNLPKEQEAFKRVKSDIYRYGISTFNRFLPASSDTFKPIHRRILYTLWNNSIKGNVKVNKLAGLTLSLHPHGDAAISGAIIKMAQDGVTANHALLSPEGSFGNISDLQAASPRYISVRPSNFGNDAVFSLLDSHTMEFCDGEDLNEKEPKYIPTKLPIALINGSLSIVESFTSNIPQHNLIEICDIIIKYIFNKSISAKELAKGLYPDYVVGGTIINGDEIEKNYYDPENATGVVKVRGDVEIDQPNNRIIVKSLPISYDFDFFIGRIKDILNEKDKSGNPKNLILSNISYVGESRNSDKEDPYVCINCKNGTNLVEVLENLYKNTILEFTNKINLTFNVEDKVKTCTIKEVIENWYKVNFDDRQRKIIYRINSIENRIHILEGLIKVYPNIDAVIEMIKKSKESDDEIISKMKKQFNLSLIQARGIFEMKLGSLTKRSEKELSLDIKKLHQKITEFTNDLLCIDKIMVDDLNELKRCYGRPRRTKVIMKIAERKDIVISNGALLTTRNSFGIFDSSNIISGKKILNGLKSVKIDNNWVKGIINSHKIDNSIESALIFYEDGSMNSITPSVLNSWIPNNNIEENGFIKAACPIYSNVTGDVVCITKDGMLKRFGIEGEVTNRTVQTKTVIENCIFVPDSMWDKQLMLVNNKGEYLYIPLSSIPVQGRTAQGVSSSFDSGVSVRMTIVDGVSNNFAVLLENTKISEGYVYTIPISELKVGNRNNKLKKLFDFPEFKCNGIGCLDIDVKDQIALFISDCSTIGLKTTNFRNLDSPRKISCKAFDILTLTI